MQFSESWLRSFCNPSLSSDELCHLLTMAGLEVEEVEAIAPPFSKVVVAQIIAFEKHPNADKLRVCQVDAGVGEPLQIVCGAPNVEVGMKVPCALVGAELPGIEIKQAKLRGVDSFGMLCSAQELGLEQSHDGLYVFAADAPIGQNVREYLGLDDRKITIKLTPNRADCLSMLGVAREVAALTNTSLQLPEIQAISSQHTHTREVVLKAPQACPRYCGRLIQGVNVAAPTPAWMVQRLQRSGVRSISAVVDVTNYVMLELGQPLHAFDDDTLQGKIEVRLAKPNERLKLLNGDEVTIASDTLVIADESGPLALAGVMGGEASSVGDKTKNIFLESAFFQPDAIVGRARALNFATDSAHRFERGVDFELPMQAIERATALVLEICGGNPGPVLHTQSAADLPQRRSISLRLPRVSKILGVNVAAADLAAKLQSIGLQLQQSGDVWQLTPPSYRFDLMIEEDLIEEAARLIGYDNIPALPPQGKALMQALPEKRRSAHQLRALLADRDYLECINYAFVDEAWENDFQNNTSPIRLANPIAAQMAVMRSSLLGGLVANLASNQKRRASRVRLFEIGRVFERTEAQMTSADKLAGYAQPQRVAALAWGSCFAEQWGSATRRVDFYDLKSDIEALLQNTCAELQFVPTEHPALHPGRSASVQVAGKAIGIIGELHPKWVQKYELQTAPVVFELDLENALQRTLPEFQAYSRFPAVLRDLALVVKEGISAASIINTLKVNAPAYLRTIEVFDIYKGTAIETGHYSVAIRVTLQEAERTLEDAEVDATMNALVAKAQQDLGAVLRS